MDDDMINTLSNLAKRSQAAEVARMHADYDKTSKAIDELEQIMSRVQTDDVLRMVERRLSSLASSAKARLSIGKFPVER